MVSGAEVTISTTMWSTAFYSDSRGNRLERYETRRVRDSASRRLYLCGPEEVAQQIHWLAPCRALALRARDTNEWTHRFEYDGRVPPRVVRTLDLLQRVLVLRVPDPVDAALALDWYKDTSSHHDPMQWEDTHAGSLIHLGKYWGRVDCEAELVEALAEVIETHGTYAAADLVLSVPGHDQTRTSFGERVAAGVSRAVEKPLVPVKATQLLRPAAKAREGVVAQLDDEFVVGREVAGRVVIVVDDVWGHGTTMRAIATKAKANGARAVLALVGARRMRA
jgi:hypothetical protein